MRKLRIMLAAMCLTASSCGGQAQTAYLSVGAQEHIPYRDLRLSPLDRCQPKEDIAPRQCDSHTSQVCARIDYINELPEFHKYTYLLNLLRLYRTSRIVDAEKKILLAIDAARPERRIIASSTDLKRALNEAHHQMMNCLDDRAKSSLSLVEHNLASESDELNRAGILASAAQLFAELGDKEGALDRILLLRVELSRFRQSNPNPGKYDRTRYASQSLMFAAAEIGEYELAASILAEEKNGNDFGGGGLIAQIAVKRGDVDTAIALLDSWKETSLENTPDKAENFPKQAHNEWTASFFARFGAINALVQQGKSSQAEALARRWNLFPKIANQPYVAVNRLIALDLAKTDPTKALSLLPDSDAPTCRNSLAIVAANHGHPEQAEKIAGIAEDMTPPHEFDQSKSLAMLQAAAKAAARIAIAYRQKGDLRRAEAVIRRSISSFYTPSQHVAQSVDLAQIAEHYASFGRPDLVQEFIDRVSANAAAWNYDPYFRWLAHNSSLRGAALALIERGEVPAALPLLKTYVLQGDDMNQIRYPDMVAPWNSATFLTSVRGRHYSRAIVFSDLMDCPIAAMR